MRRLRNLNLKSSVKTVHIVAGLKVFVASLLFFKVKERPFSSKAHSKCNLFTYQWPLCEIFKRAGNCLLLKQS